MARRDRLKTPNVSTYRNDRITDVNQFYRLYKYCNSPSPWALDTWLALNRWCCLNRYLRIVSSTTVSELYFYLCAYFIFTWLFGHFGRKVDY